jgi:hypothetical protein
MIPNPALTKIRHCLVQTPQQTDLSSPQRQEMNPAVTDRLQSYHRHSWHQNSARLWLVQGICLKPNGLRRVV